MDKEELRQYFTTWEHSLFKLKSEKIGNLTIRGIENVDYLEERNFEAASILLKRENEGSALKYFTDVLVDDPDNIHAWCNKGMYHLRKRPVELREAQEARERMEALMREEGPMKEAKVETAYWLHQKDRSPEAREKACELFESVDQLSVSQNALYLQVLTAVVKRSKETTPLIRRQFQKLINVSTEILLSKDVQHIKGVWLALIDVLSNSIPQNLLESGLVNAMELTQLVECYDGLTLSFCAMKLVSMQAILKIQPRSNFYAKAAKICRSLAWEEENKEERESLLRSGLRAASNYQNVPASSFDQAPRLCAQMLLGIWAIKYVDSNRGSVETDYRNKTYRPQESLKRLWQHATVFYYSTTPDASPATKPLLEEARRHLEEYNIPNKSYYVPEYPRVLMLLGEPVERVEQVFKQMVDGSLEQADGFVLNLLAHQGFFYEAVGQTEQAVHCYTRATKKDDPARKAYKMAEYRLRRLTQGC